MKKITILASALTAIFLVSCKKDRVCECTNTSSSGGTNTYKVTYYDAKKKDARLLCTSESQQKDYVSPVAITGDKTTCELK